MPRPVALEPFHLVRRGEEPGPAGVGANAEPGAPDVPAPGPGPEIDPECKPECEPERDPETERLERLSRIAAALEAIAADQAALAARWLAEAAGAFGAAAERVVPRLARAGFAGTVADTVESLAREGRWLRLALAAAPEEVPEIEAALAGGRAAVEVRADPTLGPGEVRLGWDGGGAEIDVEAIAGAALAELRRALAGSADEGA